MTGNERRLVDHIVKYDQRVMEACEYIKANFNVSSEFDTKAGTLRLYVTNVNDALQILAAKEYLEETFPPGVVLVTP